MKQNIFNILKVALSNLTKLLSGVCIGFLLPRIIGITDYGLYKTFTLYATYVSIFAIGFVDGIYLKFGGKSYGELDKESFRLYSRFYMSLQIVFSLVAALISLVFLKGDLRFIFLSLSFYLFSNNVTGYFQIISQITSRFNELSLRNVIQSVSLSAGLLIAWLLSKVLDFSLSYEVFTIIYISISFLLSLWYIITYRDLIFGKAKCFSAEKDNLFLFIKIGLPLMVANLCSTLILAIDRQCVNIFFDTDTYAVYAFAYNLLSLITTALAAVSTVLYPILKKLDDDSLKQHYTHLISIILIIVFISLLVYFPLCPFIRWFLPKYEDSLIIFRIILPGLSISSAITIIMHNYYKTLGHNFQFFIKSVAILLIAFLANFIAYSIFKTTISISIASIFVMLLWYFLVEEYFIRSYKIKRIKNLLYLSIMGGGFYIITIWDLWRASMLIYFAFLFAITYCMFFKELKEFISLFKNTKNLENIEK